MFALRQPARIAAFGPMRFEPVSFNPRHEPIFPDNDPIVVGKVRTILNVLRYLHV